ncbi:MAG: RNA polymerase factor sigma-54 [Armatimonadia bacterium]
MVALSTQLLTQPRLQQSVSPQVILQSHILELAADDLRERVAAELQDNPALELADDVYFLPAPVAPPALPYDSVEALERLCAPYTLADDLRLQLTHVPEQHRSLCEYLIECLDDRGFLDADLRDVAAHFDTTTGQVEAALTHLQALEPAGIGARNLRECLLLQLDRFNAAQVPPHTRDFISAYLNTDRQGSPSQTAGALGLADNDFAAIIKFIASRLHMWPADKFHDDQHSLNEPAHALFPDARITLDGEQLSVQVSQSWSRALRVSEAYSRLERDLTARPTGQEGQRLTERIQEARTFIHQLTRRETMLKQVTEAIAAHQYDFFFDGAQALQPLTRKEIATRVGVHESTISRVTAGKYVQLPNEQLVPFDYFFDNSLSAKAILRSLIEREDPHRPLSDGALATRLQSAGYPLARRTVAKYRDALDLPPAHQRKRA